MRQPEDRDRPHPRIAEDDLVKTLGGGVAVVSGLEVQLQHLADLRQLLQKRHRLPGGFVLAVTAFGVLLCDLARVPDAQKHLLGELRVDPVEETFEVAADRLPGQVLPADVPGENQLVEMTDDLPDGITGRQGRPVDVVQLRVLLIRLGQGLDRFGEVLFRILLFAHEDTSDGAAEDGNGRNTFSDTHL